MANKAGKGSQFERDFCRKLSLWWSDGERDDLFWRTDSSGGRAKLRGRKGKQTINCHGDICATSTDGEPLIQLITFELKRGYSRVTPHDALDGENGIASPFEKWIEQVRESAQQAGTQWWMLIHKRDRRRIMAFIPTPMFDSFPCLVHGPYANMEVTDSDGHPLPVSCIPFDLFLSLIPGDDMKKVAKGKLKYA